MLFCESLAETVNGFFRGLSSRRDDQEPRDSGKFSVRGFRARFLGDRPTGGTLPQPLWLSMVTPSGRAIPHRYLFARGHLVRTAHTPPGLRRFRPPGVAAP